MTSDIVFQMLNDDRPEARHYFDTHFDSLAHFSKQIARESGQDDWRVGFINATLGEIRMTDSASHKIMYTGALLKWLSENMPEFEPD